MLLSLLDDIGKNLPIKQNHSGRKNAHELAYSKLQIAFHESLRHPAHQSLGCYFKKPQSGKHNKVQRRNPQRAKAATIQNTSYVNTPEQENWVKKKRSRTIRGAKGALSGEVIGSVERQCAFWRGMSVDTVPEHAKYGLESLLGFTLNKQPWL